MPTLGGARGAVRQEGTPAAGQTSQTSPGHQRGDSRRSRVALTPSGHSLSPVMCSSIRGATEAAPEGRLQGRAPDGRGPGLAGSRAQGLLRPARPESALTEDPGLRTGTPWALSFILLR